MLANPELQGTIGWLFFHKLFILMITIVSSMLIFRIFWIFCRVLCPLGAIYALCNRIHLYQIQVDKNACYECGKCAKCAKWVLIQQISQTLSSACARQALKVGLGVRWRSNANHTQQNPVTSQHTCQKCDRTDINI